MSKKPKKPNPRALTDLKRYVVGAKPFKVGMKKRDNKGGVHFIGKFLGVKNQPTDLQTSAAALAFDTFIRTWETTGWVVEGTAFSQEGVPAPAM